MLRSFHILSKKTHELIGRKEDRRMRTLWTIIVWNSQSPFKVIPISPFWPGLNSSRYKLDRVGMGQNHTMSDAEGCVIFRHLPWHEHG